MTCNEIVEKVLAINKPETDFVVFESDNQKCYFGVNSDGNIVFMIPSLSQSANPMRQETKSLSFYFNKKCKLQLDDSVISKTMHVLVCKETETDKMVAFIRLTHAFSVQDTENDRFYLPKLFTSISALFDKERKVSEIELQGLFAELYTILYFYQNNIDLSRFWQSKDKMKFDFSLTNTKRLEIKSTIKPERTHHFKHDQLLSELYDIKVVSVLLQKNDRGLSLGDIIESIRTIFADNFALLMHIDSIVARIDSCALDNFKYDKAYLEDKIAFFDAKDIPHFAEKTPEGVFNAEYDCSLDNVHTMSLTEIRSWLN